MRLLLDTGVVGEICQQRTLDELPLDSAELLVEGDAVAEIRRARAPRRGRRGRSQQRVPCLFLRDLQPGGPHGQPNERVLQLAHVSSPRMLEKNPPRTD